MEAYTNKWAAVIGLHERGFTEDFELSGNNLLWVQQRLLLPLEEVTLIEFHHFGNSLEDEVIIFGVIANLFCSQGILISHQNRQPNKSIAYMNNEFIKAKQLQNEYSYPNMLCNSF